MYIMVHRKNLAALIIILLLGCAASVIQEQGDCSKTGRIFRRLSSTVYKCDGDFRSYECYPGHAIPPWVTLAKADPCVCMTRIIAGRKELLCPNPPALNEDEAPKGTDSRIVIKDTGCPEAPFFKYARTFRTALPATYPLELSGMKQFVAVQEECKYRCLVDPKCVGVQYGPTGNTGIYAKKKCTAFSELPESASEFTPNEYYNYYWRVKCTSEPEGKQGQIKTNHTNVPTTTLPPPLTRPAPKQGMVLVNTNQMGGYLNGTGVTESHCYAICMLNNKCEAADFHKQLGQCWLHDSTSCYSHTRSTRGCCNHFKKNIKTCRPKY